MYGGSLLHGKCAHYRDLQTFRLRQCSRVKEQASCSMALKRNRPWTPDDDRSLARNARRRASDVFDRRGASWRRSGGRRPPVHSTAARHKFRMPTRTPSNEQEVCGNWISIASRATRTHSSQPTTFIISYLSESRSLKIGEERFVVREPLHATPQDSDNSSRSESPGFDIKIATQG